LWFVTFVGKSGEELDIVAPALAKAITSLAEETPPQPIIGILPLVNL